MLWFAVTDKSGRTTPILRQCARLEEACQQLTPHQQVCIVLSLINLFYLSTLSQGINACDGHGYFEN